MGNAAMDAQALAASLGRKGMSQAEACAKGPRFAQAIEALERLGQGPRPSPYLLFVPGRVELLGKHTDYAGGRSLLATLERGFCFTAVPRGDRTIRMVDAATGQRIEFAFEPELVPAAGHWANYPMTVARRVARNFPGELRGAEVGFVSDLPPAAGMSSSSAMMIGVFHVLSHVNRLADRDVCRASLSSPVDLAGYLATIENGQSFGPLAGDRGVGTFGGSEDHTAICCCRPGQLHLFSFCPARLERTIDLPAGYVLAIASSGVPAEKTGAAMARYNRASGLVAALVELWRTETGRADRCLADALRSSPGASDRLRRLAGSRGHAAFDGPSMVRRMEHFLGENERIIPAAAEAMAQGRIGEFGSLVDESQHLAEELLENQIPQTIQLARTARQLGAAAASAFGAGFGGSVWAMVPAASAAEFLAEWSQRYADMFPADAPASCFFASGAGPGLIEL